MSTWPSVLSALLTGEQLTPDAASWAMAQIMDGEATHAQVAGFAVALRAKGETADEVGALVATMLDRAARITVDGPAVDTCGSGGDRSHTVNLSTMAAVVVAGTGTTVVKHGNRAASSTCGSADLLEALGVAIDLTPAAVEECVRRAGIGFCFAPVFHPALRHTGQARRDLGVATVFNFLGPLTNPAQPGAQAVGVSDARMAPVLAGVLAARGTSALVFRGDDGLDELTTATTSRVWRVGGGSVTEEKLDPAELGIAASSGDDLRGADAATNAGIARAVFDGERGAVRDAVLLNAAAALTAARGADSPLGTLVDELRFDLARAAESVDSGGAAAALDRWAAATQELRPAT
ncbi:MAG TPA: anthranilate phosphoribosyltransferase [Mycobacteriales bacterium]|jgi:anthranilate phosphoribosyltransferase|nr:anthranilate phosphoribosyltransferase [Mycobacteriales bacterium]